MKLIKIIDQHRRDFKGLYECEGCKTQEQDQGLYSYDDDNFYVNVIPARKCKSCGKSTRDLGIEPEKVATKYAPHEVI